MHWEVVVVGAGAAGLVAAARAAERGRQTLLLEKNRKPGVKILMSGGTRCNLTHNTDVRGIIRAYGPPGKFLHSALAALSPQDVVALFNAEGVATKVEDTGKVFPESNKAYDVLQALLGRLTRSGAELAVEEPIENLTRAESGFELVTNRRTITAQQVIVTTGGQSYPGCGTVGDGYRWLEALGHTIVPPHPALVPVTSDAGWLPQLSGVTLPDVGVQVIDAQQRVLESRRGSFLFTHFGLSGPAVMDASRAIAGHAQPRSLRLVCDFLPSLREDQLEVSIGQQCSQGGKKNLLALVPLEIPRRLAETLLDQVELSPAARAAELGKPARKRLVHALKRHEIPVSGTRGFKKAEVTAGGVSLSEVDSRTLQSKLITGLYLAGEILDLDGPIGGFNFQAAFSTGFLAGESV